MSHVSSTLAFSLSTYRLIHKFYLYLSLSRFIINNLWGRVLEKFQEARAVVYADDGYIMGKLSVTLQVLAEPKNVYSKKMQVYSGVCV